MLFQLICYPTSLGVGLGLLDIDTIYPVYLLYGLSGFSSPSFLIRRLGVADSFPLIDDTA
jgi:hypothetical protein